MRDACIVLEHDAAARGDCEACAVKAQRVAVLVGNRQVAGDADFTRAVLVGAGRCNGGRARKRENAATGQRTAVPGKAVADGDVGSSAERAAAEFQIGNAGRRSGGEGAPAQAKQTGTRDLRGEVGRDSAAGLLHGARPREQKIAADDVVRRTVRRHEKRAAFGHGNASARPCRELRQAVARSVVTFVEVDVCVR